MALQSDRRIGRGLLARELGVVEGVAVVDVSGGVEEEVRVLIDLSRLQALGVVLDDVLNELAETNQDISGGRILGELNEPLTRAVGRFEDAESILDLAFEVENVENSATGEFGDCFLLKRRLV